MKLRINEEVLRQNRIARTADDYRLPQTLGAPPKAVQKALDSCFSPTRTIIGHALEQLGEEGMPVFPGYGLLSGLAQNGLIRAGVEMRADEMTRKWGEFVSTSDEEQRNAIEDKAKRLDADIKKLHLQNIFRKVAAYCGYMGGALGFIDTGSGPEEWVNPLVLSPQTFGIGTLRGIKLVEPVNVTPGPYNSTNPLADDYYKPKLWYIQGIPVHKSRLLYFTENELPILLRPAYNFFGLSLTQKVLDAVSHYTSCRESASRLLQKYSLTVLKTNMQDILSGGFDQNLARRVEYFNRNRDSDGTAAIDKNEEDLVIMTTSLAGVTDVVRQAMEYVAAMFNEPVTKMWGLSPAGFNTGDADLKNHYDNIASLQQKIFAPAMDQLTRVLQMNAFGEIDENISFEFAPLSEDDEVQLVTNNKTKAETAALLMENQVLSPEEVRQSLIDDPKSGYDSLTPTTEPTLDPADLQELQAFDPKLDELQEPSSKEGDMSWLD